MSSKIDQTDLGSVMGNRVALKKSSNRVVVTNRPKRKFPLTGDQESVQDRFLEASQYAKLQMADEEAKAYYQQGVTESVKSAYTVAMKDYLYKPRVKAIDTVAYEGLEGNTIDVVAKSGFKTSGVKVFITDRKGNLIEKGDAVNVNIHLWRYTATVANPSLPGTIIRAVAYSRPGNKGELVVTL